MQLVRRHVAALALAATVTRRELASIHTMLRLSEARRLLRRTTPGRLVAFRLRRAGRSWGPSSLCAKYRDEWTDEKANSHVPARVRATASSWNVFAALAHGCLTRRWKLKPVPCIRLLLGAARPIPLVNGLSRWEEIALVADEARARAAAARHMPSVFPRTGEWEPERVAVVAMR